MEFNLLNTFGMLLLVITVFFGAPSCLGSVEVQTQLERTLLQNYSRNVRPNASVSVRLGMSIDNILELDIVSQQMVVAGNLIVFWNDPRLTWDPADYANISELYFKVDDIWRPLLVLTNTVDEIKAIGDDSDQRSMTMSAQSDGSMVWLAPAFFKSVCPADVSMFPFDTQTCEMLISSWLFSDDIFKLTPTSNDVSLDNCDENGEYLVVRTYAEIRERVAYPGHPQWSFAVFGLEMQRRYSYHVINVVLPVLFLEILGVVVFWVPASSGEKLSYALTMMLAMVVMTTLVAEHIPSTSVQIPIMSIFVIEGVTMSVVELLLTVYLLQMYRRHDDGETPKGFIRVLGSLLAKCCCSKNNKVNSINTPIIVEVQPHDQIPGKTAEADLKLPERQASPDVPSQSYKDIADMLEKACFWFFTVATVAFILHAGLTIALGFTNK